MSFEQFRNSITSEDLLKVALHWRDVRAAQSIPGWSQIRPSAIKSQLPIVWSYSYDLESDEFTGRLAGEKVARLLKSSFKGLRLPSEGPDVTSRGLFARNKRVVTEPAFFRGYGAVVDHDEHISLGERIVMPLATDGKRCDGLLGATAYTTVAKFSLKDPNATAEQESWFSLI